jgi:hypothetical protein
MFENEKLRAISLFQLTVVINILVRNINKMLRMHAVPVCGIQENKNIDSLR